MHQFFEDDAFLFDDVDQQEFLFRERHGKGNAGESAAAADVHAALAGDRRRGGAPPALRADGDRAAFRLAMARHVFQRDQDLVLGQRQQPVAGGHGARHQLQQAVILALW